MFSLLFPQFWIHIILASTVVFGMTPLACRSAMKASHGVWKAHIRSVLIKGMLASCTWFHGVLFLLEFHVTSPAWRSRDHQGPTHTAAPRSSILCESAWHKLGHTALHCVLLRYFVFLLLGFLGFMSNAVIVSTT